MTQKFYSWVYLKKTPLIQKDTCTPMFIAALFTRGKLWKQLKCLSIDEWIKKIWLHIYIYIHTHTHIYTYINIYISHLFIHISEYMCMCVYIYTTQPYQTWNNGLVQIQKGVHQGCILSPCLFNFYAEYIMQNDRLDEWQIEIKIARRNINNLTYVDDTTLMADSEEEWKSLLMKVKEESEKAGLKFNIQKTKITASDPITSWQIDGEKMETVTDFIFLDSKITVDSDCSYKIKRRLLLGGKAMTNLDSVLKSRDITLPTKVHIVKAMVFPVVTYGCESWITKNAEHQGTDAFKLWCWKRPLRVPWTARRSNQSILKEINPENSLEGLMLKVKL